MNGSQLESCIRSARQTSPHRGAFAVVVVADDDPGHGVLLVLARHGRHRAELARELVAHAVGLRAREAPDIGRGYAQTGRESAPVQRSPYPRLWTSLQRTLPFSALIAPMSVLLELLSRWPRYLSHGPAALMWSVVHLPLTWRQGGGRGRPRNTF